VRVAFPPRHVAEVDNCTGRGTVDGTLAARLSIYSGQVFSCLTGDRDSRPNAGEERSLLGANTGPPPALWGRRALALSLGADWSDGKPDRNATGSSSLSRCVGTGIYAAHPLKDWR
jgi:hypothetical protein